jgi:hypothetical protein
MNESFYNLSKMTLFGTSRVLILTGEVISCYLAACTVQCLRLVISGCFWAADFRQLIALINIASGIK